jgi:hypothetical protein
MVNSHKWNKMIYLQTQRCFERIAQTESVFLSKLNILSFLDMKYVLFKRDVGQLLSDVLLNNKLAVNPFCIFDLILGPYFMLTFLL